MPQVKLCLIVARARNGVIGLAGGLPWQLRDDLAFFKRTTSGCPIIMGRATWESLPVQPLPGRENIVLSRDWKYAADGARVYSSFAPAMNAAKSMARKGGCSEIYVIGGVALYKQAISMADRIYVTHVEADPEGDAFFPEIDDSEWDKVMLETHTADDRNEYDFKICRLDRKS